MSLYNALFGFNPYAKILLALLDIDQENGKYQSGRFRDIYLSDDGSKIVLYTRNGGGNREDYEHVFSNLREHPNYLTDFDDDFDCTYASIEFTTPKEFLDTAKMMLDTQDNRTPSDKFMDLCEQLKTGKKSDATDRALKIGKEIFGKIASGQKIVTV